MADRPRNGGPEDGPQEYGWLYGKKQPREPRPEETRVMPVQPRDGGRSRAVPGQPARGGSSSTPPRSPAPTPAPTPRSSDPADPTGPTGPSRGGRGRGFRLPRPRVRWVFLLLLAWIAYLVIVPVMAWNDVDKVAFEPDGDRPGDQPGTTYLMVGSDSREGLTKEQRKELATGNVAGRRTDTIMLLHTGSGPNVLMSIPRDSQVEVPGHGRTKINAAYAYGGAKLLVQTIEQSTGIRIDEYAEVGLGGVVEMVDAIGGIEICPTTDMVDKLAGLDIDKGCQEADGRTALAFARSRHTDPRYGDITRAKHQREVVSAVGDEVKSPATFINPFRYWSVWMAVPDAFKFGDGMSPVGAAKWALAMTRVNGQDGMTCGVPIADLSVRWDPERSQQFFDYLKEDRTDDLPKGLCTPTGLPKSVTG